MPIDKSCLERYNIKIEDLKPKIFESIVAIYGEKYRELINDRLNRIYINHNVTYEDIVRDKVKIADKFMIADMFGESIGEICLPKGRISVIIGNEGQGVSESMRTLTDIKVKIPMTPLVESLNAGVAGSIIMQRISEKVR
mgnify:CR=1 FL=1